MRILEMKPIQTTHTPYCENQSSAVRLLDWKLIHFQRFKTLFRYLKFIILRERRIKVFFFISFWVGVVLNTEP